MNRLRRMPREVWSGLNGRQEKFLFVTCLALSFAVWPLVYCGYTAVTVPHIG